jgi:6-phosphogluconate dehydrogenase
MMVGGEKQTYEYCKPLFHSMCQKEGYALVGQGGAGHYVKMIHNAVEYGMMQAIAEGFHLLEHGKFKVDAGKVAHVWNNGCIISGFLMERTEDALKQGIKNIKPWVEETGEGRWSVLESIEQKVPFTVNTYALQARLRSQDPEGYDFKLLAGVRQQFGGHKVKR